MKKLRFGILGGTRGIDFLTRVLLNHPYAEVAAICENYAPIMEKIGQDFKGIKVCADFDEFLDEGLDAVIIANFANDHARYAVKALNKGVNVFCESLPSQTMAEAVSLCEAVEKSGKLYAYGENYCYLPHVFEMRKIFESGEMGELMYAEGVFINDCSFKWHLLTRGERNHWRNFVPSTFYCTHSLGPVMFVSGRRAVNVVGMETQRMPHMAQVGARSASAAMEIMQLDNGGMAKSCNGNYRRAYSCDYRFIAENGTVETSLEKFGEIKVIMANKGERKYNFDTRFPGGISEKITGIPINCNTPPFELADICCINIFIQSLLGNECAKKYMIDIYKALDMSTPGLLAYRSILSGNNAIAVPNLRNADERAIWANDNKSTDASKSFGEDLLPPCKDGFAVVDDKVYENVKNEFLNSRVKFGSN